MTAPLQVIALSFSRDAGAEDRILAEVDRLRGRGVLRLLDMLFVAKSQDGTIERLATGDDEDFGSLLAAVVPVADGGPAVLAPAGGPAFDPADAQPITLKELPPQLVRDWMAADGRALIQVFPKGDPNDNAAMRDFAARSHAGSEGSGRSRGT